MMAVIAAEKPKKAPKPEPILLKIEVPISTFPDTPQLSSPSRSLSPPPKTPSPKIATPVKVKVLTPVKPDTPEPVIEEVIINKCSSPTFLKLKRLKEKIKQRKLEKPVEPV
jgi:hypothetical protein